MENTEGSLKLLCPDHGAMELAKYSTSDGGYKLTCGKVRGVSLPRADKPIGLYGKIIPIDKE